MGLRVVAASVLVAALLAAGSEGRAAAVDPIIGTPIPDEPAPISELAQISDALVVDLDGDGVRELLTLGPALGNDALVTVQATWVSADGVAQASNQLPLHWSDGGHTFLVSTEDAAHLLPVHRAGTMVPLVATGGVPGSCCLSLWEVQAHGDRLTLRQVTNTQQPAQNLVAADLDGDGTDELVVAEGPDHGVNFILAVGILRWEGDQFVRTGASVPSIGANNVDILDAGDSDGLPGEEVLVSGPSTNGPHSVYRISLRASVPFVERAESADAALVVSREQGPAIIASYRGGPLEAWTWPRDDAPQRLRLFGDGEVAMTAVAAMDRAHLWLGAPVETPSGPPRIGLVRVFGGNTRAEASREFASDERAEGFLDALPGFDDPRIYDAGYLPPFVGAIPGGISGTSDAFMFAGQLLRPDPGPDRLVTAREVALLPGLEPGGTVGPEGAWMALLPRRVPFPLDRAWSDHPVVDMLSSSYWLDGSLRVVRTASVLEPEQNGGRLTPTFHGVAPSHRGDEELLVRDEPVEADIVGPPGTTVGWWTEDAAQREVIGPKGSIHIRLLPPFGSDVPDGTSVPAHVWAITPAGRGYADTWQITVHHQPPQLDVSEDAPFIDPNPTLSGRTDPGATVTVNGAPVTVAADGSYESPVDVGLVPTDLRVVAVDPLGNRAEVVVSRVSPLDYRQLPFAPLGVLATIVAAAILFLRKPDSGPDHRSPEDGATFEEIGG